MLPSDHVQAAQLVDLDESLFYNVVLRYKVVRLFHQLLFVQLLLSQLLWQKLLLN